MNGGERANDGSYRVRHMHAGLYVAFTLSHATSDAGRADGVELSLVRRPDAALFDRKRAERVAAAWISLTGDTRIEIEPLEG